MYSGKWCHNVKCKRDIEAGEKFLELCSGDLCEDCARVKFWLDMSGEGKFCEKCGCPSDDMYIVEDKWFDGKMICEDCFNDLMEEAPYASDEPEPDDNREDW